MLEFVLFYLSTVAASMGTVSFTMFKNIKKIANNGYKINVSKVYDLNGKFIPDEIRQQRAIMYLIPIKNLKDAYEMSIQINEKMYDIFELMGVLEEMTPDEIEEYSNHPTGYNALKIAFLSYKSQTQLPPNNQEEELDYQLPETNDFTKEERIDERKMQLIEQKKLLLEKREYLKSLKEQRLEQKSSDLQEQPSKEKIDIKRLIKKK